MSYALLYHVSPRHPKWEDWVGSPPPPSPIWTLWRTEKSSATAGKLTLIPWSPAQGLIAVPNELFLLPREDVKKNKIIKEKEKGDEI
jgi:hypothetical protein